MILSFNIFVYKLTVLKKVSIIILISVLAYSQVGYYFVMRHFQFSQKDVIKEKILNQIKEAELQVISFTDNKEIFWEEKGKEFLFKGEMYDVVKTKRVNGKLMLYCIKDIKEKALIDNYNLVTKQNSSAEKKGKNLLDNSFDLFIYQVEQNGNLVATRDPNKFYFIVPHLTHGVDNNTSPPPKA